MLIEMYIFLFFCFSVVKWHRRKLQSTFTADDRQGVQLSQLESWWAAAAGGNYT